MPTRREAPNGLAVTTLRPPAARSVSAAALPGAAPRRTVRHAVAAAVGLAAVHAAAACGDATAPRRAPGAVTQPPAAALGDTLPPISSAADPGVTLQQRIAPELIAGRMIPPLTVKRRIRWYLSNGAAGLGGLKALPTADQNGKSGVLDTSDGSVLVVDASEFKDLGLVRLSHRVAFNCIRVIGGKSYVSAHTSPLPAASAGDQSFTPDGPPSKYKYGYLVWEAFNAGLLTANNGSACSIKPADAPGGQPGLTGSYLVQTITFTATYTTKGSNGYPADTASESRTLWVRKLQ